MFLLIVLDTSLTVVLESVYAHLSNSVVNFPCPGPVPYHYSMGWDHPRTFTLSVFSLYSLYSTRSFNQNNVDYCNLTLPYTLNTTHNNEVSMVSACHLLVATSKTTIILYFSRVYLLLLLLLRHKLKYISWARSRFSPISTHKHFGTSGSKYSSS